MSLFLSELAIKKDISKMCKTKIRFSSENLWLLSREKETANTGSQNTFCSFQLSNVLKNVKTYLTKKRVGHFCQIFKKDSERFQ